jgi:HK97 family phage portal protein
VSLFRRQHTRDHAGATAQELIPQRTAQRTGTVVVTQEMALRHSAVWACLRLRADHVSTMPVDCYRKVLGVQIEVPKPPVLINPGGERVGIQEWLYSSQVDLDRMGNAIGIITQRSGFGSGTGSGEGLPARINLVPAAEVSVRVINGELDHYRIGGEKYQPSEIWHEKQYTVPGLHVGLSPVAYAAWSAGLYLSIQEFALDWFGNGAIPTGKLRNTQKTINQTDAAAIKARFKAAVAGRDLFVTGADWDYDMIQAQQAESSWLEAKGASNAEIARFFNCPADLIDAAVQIGGNITYQNITQRNLQFLVMNLGPTVARRESALSNLLARPRFVKLNAAALLRMDPQTRAATNAALIASRQRAPSEVREKDDLPPFTEAQLSEFDRLFGPPRAKEPATSPAPQGVPG